MMFNTMGEGIKVGMKAVFLSELDCHEERQYACIGTVC